MKRYFEVVKKVFVKVDDVEQIQFIDSKGNACKTFDAITNNNVAAKKSSDKDRVYKETCTLLGGGYS